MNIKDTVESVAREVILSMKEKREKELQPKVLFIFCDSKAHEPFQDEFIKLNQNNISYDLLFLDGETSSWLGLHQIECSGADKVIASDEHAPVPIELPLQYDGIIIPEIDLDNAARIVTGLKGTIKAEVVFSALVTNKLLLIGSDSIGLKRSDRQCLNKIELTEYYKNTYKGYMNQIKQMGIKLVPANRIVTHTIEKINAMRNVDKEASVTTKNGSQQATFQGKILTATWVESNKDKLEEKILLEKRTIISPLAQDLLKEYGTIVKYIS